MVIVELRKYYYTDESNRQPITIQLFVLFPQLNLLCVRNKMELTLIIVFVGLIGAGQGTPTKELIKKASDCITNTIPFTDFVSGNDYLYDYMVNISYQWDPLNHHDYLYWWKYEGPEARRAGCHFSDTLRRCLQPIMEQKRDLNYYWKEKHTRVITDSLYYLTLCKHQNVLINNAVCIHNRMLSDDVLRCSGVLGWMRSNQFLLINKWISQNFKTAVFKSYGNVLSSVYECIYTRGQWKRACGEAVDGAISQIKNQFIQLIKTYTRLSAAFADMSVGPICDRCNEESNLKLYKHFNHIILFKLKDLLFYNQSPVLFKQCHLVDYPLNHCHIKNIWRRDVFNMFCHNVTNIIAPQLKPYLPLCDFDEWIESAERICNMGYDSR